MFSTHFSQGGFANQIIFKAFPGVPLFGFLRDMKEYFLNPIIYPIYADRDGETFRFKEEEQKKNEIVEKIIERRISFDEQGNMSKDSCVQALNLKTRISSILTERNQLSMGMKKELGIHKMRFYFSIPNFLNKNNFLRPYRVHPGIFSSSILVNHPLDALINANCQIKKEKKSLDQQRKTSGAFCIALELAHLAQRTFLKFILMEGGITCLNLWIWTHGWDSTSYLTCFNTNLMNAFLLQMVASILFQRLSMHLEKKADEKAIDVLGYRDGAIEFLELIQEKEDIHFLHLSATERLTFIRGDF